MLTIIKWHVYAFLFEFHLISGERFSAATKAYVEKMGKSWRLSGFDFNNGDAGCIDIGWMSERKAIRTCHQMNPRAAIIHIDRDNRIITYRLSR